MRLIELTCDQPSFHTVTFNREGLTLIVGDGSNDKTKEGSSNGVGKTLALGLLHHCLGGTAEARIKKAVPDWIFGLLFEINGTTHYIERSGDGKKIVLDQKTTSLAELRRWLDTCGVFRIDPDVPLISFRSLFKRFSRYRREDCNHPIHLSKEQDFDGTLRSLYLLGLDTSLAARKRRLKLDLDATTKTMKDWEHDTVLREVLRAGAKPQVRADWLEREIPRLRADRDRFKVAEDYRVIELQAGTLTTQLREIEKAEAILRFQEDSIDKALANNPDISKTDLLELYTGLQSIFKPEVLTHFDKVEQFHKTLTINRKARLERDRRELAAKAKKLAADYKEIAERRDERIQSLAGKRALDEFAALTQHIASLEEEHKRLNEYLNLSVTLQNRAQKIREEKVIEDREAQAYVADNPVASIDDHFRNLAEIIYPHTPAGIVIENNTGENQSRFNLTVQIEGDDSDGINSARIICFDWVLLMHGANQAVDCLWHDNRLFADIDPKGRSAWFTHLDQALKGTGKQYVASLNTENFQSMREFASEESWVPVAKSVKLVLRGDRPENKLLGIQFGSSASDRV